MTRPQPSFFDKRAVTLLDVLQEPVLRPADLVTCEHCGQGYGANGAGHIRHAETCPGRAT